MEPASPKAVDCETLLKSLIFMADGVAATIGDNGARATMRLAGHRAAVSLLEALPLEFEIKAAIQRVGPVMTELGFVSDLTFDNKTRVTVSGNAIVIMLRQLGLEPQRHPACYYTIGLFEGFVQVLSKTRVSIVRQEFRDTMEIWTLMK